MADRGFAHADPKVKHDREDLAVWKLSDNVRKLDYRHWVEAMEINLEYIHSCSKPDAVLNLIRREESEVSADSLKTIVRRASEKLEDDGMGPVDSSDWGDFEMRSIGCSENKHGDAREGRRHQQKQRVRALPEHL